MAEMLLEKLLTMIQIDQEPAPLLSSLKDWDKEWTIMLKLKNLEKHQEYQKD